MKGKANKTSTEGKSTRKKKKRKYMAVVEALKKRSLTWDKARRIAKDKTKWKKTVQKTENEGEILHSKSYLCKIQLS